MSATVADDVLIARGRLSTLNAQRRDLQRALHRTADAARSALARAHGAMQADVFDACAVDDDIETVREALDEFSALAAQLAACCVARAALRPLAWGDA